MRTLRYLVPILVLAAGTAAGDDKKPVRDHFEIDLSTVPERLGRRSDFTLLVETSDKTVRTKYPVGLDVGVYRPHLTDGVAESLKSAGYEVEIVGDTKVRVYQWKKKDRVLPVTKITVTSNVLTPEQQPKITDKRAKKKA